MSVIAWDGRTLAADTGMVTAGMRARTSKMAHSYVNDQSVICAWTGDHGLGHLLAQWYFDGADPETFPNKFAKEDEWCRLIVADRDGCFFYENYPAKIIVHDKYMAWGSGRDFAMGAMFLGASAEEAVNAACEHSTECWGPAEVRHLV